MSTNTTRVSLYKPVGGEDINVTTDLNANLDKIDTNLNFRVVANAAARNAISPTWEGLNVRESDTGNCYVSNGSAPVSGSWTQLATAGSALSITGTNMVSLSGTLNTTDKLAAMVAGDGFDRFRMAADGTMAWGPGSGARDLTLARTGTSTLGTGSGDNFQVGGDLYLANGSTVFRNKLSAVTTVATTASESTIASFTIPANDAVVGAVYRITAFGTLGCTSAPTIQFRMRLGGVAGTAMVQFPTQGIRGNSTDNYWTAEFYLTCVTTGASGTWAPMAKYAHNFITSVTTYTNVGPITGVPVTRSTTSASDMVITAQWSASSASNTITCRGYAAERLA